MKRKIILSIIITIPLIISMAMIFYFSSQDSGSSNNLSRDFTCAIAKRLFKSFPYMQTDVQGTIIYELNLFIRKAAHFSVFFFMSAFIYAETVIWVRSYFFSGVISVFISMVYAVIDEYHQSFTPGRTPMIKDVFIDTAGAILGAAACFCIISVIFHVKVIMQKNNSSQLSASL
ncbi:MAG: VanZ family protein [Ruminococcus sp.]|nr:VanZ family protein [Ruminococcus sp.]